MQRLTTAVSSQISPAGEPVPGGLRDWLPVCGDQQRLQGPPRQTQRASAIHVSGRNAVHIAPPAPISSEARSQSRQSFLLATGGMNNLLNFLQFDPASQENLTEVNPLATLMILLKVQINWCWQESVAFLGFPCSISSHPFRNPSRSHYS